MAVFKMFQVTDYAQEPAVHIFEQPAGNLWAAPALKKRKKEKEPGTLLVFCDTVFNLHHFH